MVEFQSRFYVAFRFYMPHRKGNGSADSRSRSKEITCHRSLSKKGRSEMPGLFLPMLGSAQNKRVGGKYPSGHIRKSVTKERRLTEEREAALFLLLTTCKDAKRRNL